MIFFAFLWSTSFLKKTVKVRVQLRSQRSGELVAVFLGLKDFRMNMWGKSVL